MANDYEETLLEKYREKFKAMAKIINNMAKEINKLDAENNVLRYEMMIARYRYFYLLAYHYACEGEAKDSKKSKCTRIAAAYEARAAKLKEVK